MVNQSLLHLRHGIRKLYLTMEEAGAIEGNIYKDTNELMMAYANGYVRLHSVLH